MVVLGFALGLVGVADVGSDWDLVFLVAVGLAIAAYGVVRAFDGVRGIRTAFVVREGGLVCRTGNRTQALRWEGIVSITSRFVRPASDSWSSKEVNHHHTIRLSNGSTVNAGDTTYDAEHLLELIEERVVPVLYEKDAKAVLRGQQVQYGDFRLSADGIRCRARFVPWTEVVAVTIESGKFVVRSRIGRVEADVVTGKVFGALGIAPPR